MSANVVHPVFRALDETGGGKVSVTEILSRLDQAGLPNDDPRLAALTDGLRRNGSEIDGATFDRLSQSGRRLLERAVRQELVLPSFGDFSATVSRIYEATLRNEGGALAQYIPQLARVDPDQFGVAVCTIDGQRLSLGDAAEPFSFQSSCKPLLYSAALELHGEARVHDHIGREPSGQSFNELTLNKASRPHNPMINAGAIMSTSLLHADWPMADRFDYLTSLIGNLTGGRRPGFNNAIYHSERETADRNFALAHYMREVRAFPEGTDILATLDLYFAACSIETTAQQMATIAATYANGGVCPPTGERVFSGDTVKNCLSMMNACGMYDYSGEFAFRVGMPAKSGVCGAIMAVVPNVMGIAVWSPHIDQNGNSVRGVEFLHRLVETFNFHNYDSLVETRKLDPRHRRKTIESNATFSAIHAASCGDIDELKRLVAYGHTMDSADYDGRTPLHLAAAEGHDTAVAFLIRQGVDLAPEDRWGNTPIEDAKRHGHRTVAALIRRESGEASSRQSSDRENASTSKPSKAA